MCGISGIYSITKDKEVSLKISEMNNEIIHRGPDDGGVYINDDINYSVAMGMRRLSIIDLNSGKQPIHSLDKSKVLVFNGEIYNYQELKTKLLKKGATFFKFVGAILGIKNMPLYFKAKCKNIVNSAPEFYSEILCLWSEVYLKEPSCSIFK